MNDAELRIAVAGLGTVGSAVVRLLQEKADVLSKRCGRVIRLIGVSARDQKRQRDIDLTDIEWFDDPIALAQHHDIDVFVELIGGEGGIAKRAIETALEAGHHVVTANKALLAHDGVGLARRAEKNEVFLNFEAAVAGGVPVVKMMREALASNKVFSVFGILNGTCNYILTRMEEDGLSFADCLNDAQKLGYAEADPTFDVEGYDTAHKLALLTSFAFGTIVSADDVYVEGISNISLADIQAAYELGYRIKLLGVSVQTETGIEQRVRPTMVPISSAIAQIGGVTNAVSVQTDLLGAVLFSGPGAGGDATASAVISDIIDIARMRLGPQYCPVFGIPTTELKSYEKGKMLTREGGYFIRLCVCDKIGVFSTVAQKMADKHISLESIVQRQAHENGNDTGVKTIILVTHQTNEAAVCEALQAISDDGYVCDKPQMIRIEHPA